MNGASVLADGRGVYKWHGAVSDMQNSIADVCREEVKMKLQKANYFGLMLDESLDIAVEKKLVLFCKFFHENKVVVQFGANVVVTDGKAETIYRAIISFLNDMNINVGKLSGLGTDGASVMMGSKQGVGTKLKADKPNLIHVWCCAHKLALVAHYAANQIDFMKKVQETMIGIFNFYNYSAVRYNKIRELTKIMNVHVKRFKKPTQVRWLSVYEAVEAVHGALSVLYIALEHEATSGSGASGEGSAKAKGLKVIIQSYKFLATLCLLKEVLHGVTRCSKVFQSDVIDIDKMDTMLTVTRQHIQSFQQADPNSLEELHSTLRGQCDQNNNAGPFVFKGIEVTKYNEQERVAFASLRNRFLNNLEIEFNKRFQENDLRVLKDLDILLNPKKLPQSLQDMQAHGQESLDRTVAFFRNDIDSGDLRESFNQYKFLVANNRDLTLQEFCLKLLCEYKNEFPSFCQIAEIMLTVPITSVPCERGFSYQNKIHSHSRNRLASKNVENKMFIQSTDLDISTLSERACGKFMSTTRSKFQYSCQSSVSPLH